MILGLFLLGTVSYQVFTKHYKSYAQLTLVNQAQSISQILQVDFDQKTLHHILKLETKPATAVFVFSSNGSLLGSSSQKSIGFQKNAKDWIRQNPNQQVLDTKIDGDPVILVKSPIRRSNVVVGTVVVVTELTWLEQAMQSLQVMLLLAGLGALLVASGLGIFLSRRMVSRILEVIKAIGQLSTGNYKVRMSVDGNDELAMLAKQVNQLAESLSYYQSSRKEFLSHVAHDLRTPITYIKGYATLLQKSNRSTNEIKKLTTIICEQSDRLNHLIHDLVSLSRLDEGKMELKKEKVNIKKVMEQITAELSPFLEDKEVRFHLDIPEEITLYLDQQRFSQIMINLLDNAVRYSKPKGNVIVSVSRTRRETRIDIKDEGIGISSQDQDRIWERFYRVEQSRSRHTGGTGLGLSIVKQLVELHGGRIEVTSIPNKGTTFSIFFPNQPS